MISNPELPPTTRIQAANANMAQLLDLYKNGRVPDAQEKLTIGRFSMALEEEMRFVVHDPRSTPAQVAEARAVVATVSDLDHRQEAALEKAMPYGGQASSDLRAADLQRRALRGERR